MEINYFSAKESSSGKYYFINKITGTTQWGSDTYFYTNKTLPEGWIRLNYNEKPLYIYIGDKIGLTSSLAYAPKLNLSQKNKILQKSYEDLDKENEEEKAEAYRRLDLFEKVADLLKLTPESICDESIEYFAKRSGILTQNIIDFIQQLERSKGVVATLFRRISRNDPSFSSERSIRELCGVNIKKVEASNAQSELEELHCKIRRTIIKEPFFCSSGHTFERAAIKDWLLDGKRTCPVTRGNFNITSCITPDHIVRTLLNNFVEKYEHQKGQIWESIVEECLEFKLFSAGSFEAENVGQLGPVSPQYTPSSPQYTPSSPIPIRRRSRLLSPPSSPSSPSLPIFSSAPLRRRRRLVSPTSSPRTPILRSSFGLENVSVPEGWLRLELHGGKHSYKYTGLTSSPKPIEILQKSYEDLNKENEEEKAEAYRRLDLFEKVADLLKLTPESICDESIEYFAKRSGILTQNIIDFIQQLERSKGVVATLFRRISRNDPSFSSERSIRELCGVNMKEIEAQNAMSQLEDLCCPIRGTIFKEPFCCSSGHTFERSAISEWLLDGKRTCPVTRGNFTITTYITPNHIVRSLLHSFVKKYEHQKGHVWKPIVEACLAFKHFSEGSFDPEYVCDPPPPPSPRGMTYEEEERLNDEARRQYEEEERLNDEARRQNNIPRTAEELRNHLWSRFDNDRVQFWDLEPVIETTIDILSRVTVSSYRVAVRIFEILLRHLRTLDSNEPQLPRPPIDDQLNEQLRRIGIFYDEPPPRIPTIDEQLNEQRRRNIPRTED